jgi:hypothetical protein
MPSTNDPKNYFGLPGNFNDSVKQAAFYNSQNQDRTLREAAAKMRREMILAEPFHRFDKQVEKLGINTRLAEYERFPVNGLNEEDQARINELKDLEKSLVTELKTIRAQALQNQTENVEAMTASMKSAGLEAADKSSPKHDKLSKGPTPPGGHAAEKDPNIAREEAEDRVLKGVASQTDALLQQHLTSAMNQYEPKINDARRDYFTDKISFSKQISPSKTQTLGRDEPSR